MLICTSQFERSPNRQFLHCGCVRTSYCSMSDPHFEGIIVFYYLSSIFMFPMHEEKREKTSNLISLFLVFLEIFLLHMTFSNLVPSSLCRTTECRISTDELLLARAKYTKKLLLFFVFTQNRRNWKISITTIPD